MWFELSRQRMHFVGIAHAVCPEQQRVCCNRVDLCSLTRNLAETILRTPQQLQLVFDIKRRRPHPGHSAKLSGFANAGREGAVFWLRRHGSSHARNCEDSCCCHTPQIFINDLRYCDPCGRILKVFANFLGEDSRVA